MFVYLCCADEDECLREVCGQYASCVNSIGSYACTCQHGFKMSTAGRCDGRLHVSVECLPIFAEGVKPMNKTQICNRKKTHKGSAFVANLLKTKTLIVPSEGAVKSM